MSPSRPLFQYSSIKSSFGDVRLNKATWYSMPKVLLHFLACSTAKISSLEMIRSLIKGNYGYATKVFKRIIALINMGFEQNRAYELIAKKVPVSFFKDFMLRFSQSIKVGEEAEDFFTREYNAFISTFKSRFDRVMVALHRLSEAHSAMLSSSVLVMAIMVFASMIWGLSQQMILSTIAAIVGIQFIMAYIFYSLSPQDHVVSCDHRLERLESLMAVSRGLGIFSLIISLSSIGLNAIGLLDITTTTLIVVTVSGLAALVGWLGSRWLTKIKNYDKRFPEFMSMVAAGLSTLGTSMKRVIDDVVKVDFGPLNNVIKRMKARLDIDVDEALCWRLFQKETCSDIIASHTTIFIESMKLGAPISKVGSLVSNSAITLLDGRRRIEEISAFLKGIMLPLQPTLYAIVGLVLVIMNSFSEVISQFGRLNLPMPLMIAGGTNLYGIFVVALSAISIANAMMLYFVNGQSPFTFTFYVGLFLASGWATLFAVHTFVGGLLKSIGLQNVIMGGG